MEDHKLIFCFGYGYSCDYLGHALMQDGGWKIAGTTRDEDRKDELKGRGISAYLFDDDTPLADASYILGNATHILISTPPDDAGDTVFRAHGNEIAHFPNLKWLGYLSTTGVYGDRDGAWVDETAELRPSSQRGSRRYIAEEQWMSLYHECGTPVHIFRLAGIYGPGRSALDTVRAGVERRINKPGHAFSRIHVDDIAGILKASINNPTPGEIFNVCDDEPAPSHEVIEYACRLLGRTPPPMVNFEDANLAPMTRSFYMDNRRVKNDKMKRTLGVALKYPDFRKGLEGCLEAEQYALRQYKEEDKQGDETQAVNPMQKFKSQG